MALKLVQDELTLIYGLRLFHGRTEDGAPHQQVAIEAPGGASAEMPLHVITGTREEIRRQLTQSLDAFFELIDPE